ncbi:MAG: hypothetical protein E7262_05420 [Lachnospiraceae bacterium]|nr:hypothetical protein [Lachnospiraceae bacterium]
MKAREELAKELKKDLISIVAQGFYGNFGEGGRKMSISTQLFLVFVVMFTVPLAIILYINNRSKKICSVTVDAEIIDIVPVRDIKYLRPIYSPVYRYKYNYVEYKTVSKNIKHTISTVHYNNYNVKIKINPDNPNEIYDQIDFDNIRGLDTNLKKGHVVLIAIVAFIVIFALMFLPMYFY